MTVAGDQIGVVVCSIQFAWICRSPRRSIRPGFRNVHRGDKAIALPHYRPDILRILRIVAQNCPELVYRGIDAVLRLDEDVSAPKSFNDGFPVGRAFPGSREAA